MPWPEESVRPIEVLFVGNFRHAPNVDAAHFLAGQIAPRFPDLQFVVPGSHVPEDLPKRANVHFPGYVSDTRVLYRRPNTIVVAPLFSGTGQRVKLLEAFAMGCPVISTALGASGFPVRTEIEALIAESAEDFAAALRRLVSSLELRRLLGTKAREMIVRDFSWQQVGAQLLDLVE